MRICLLPLVHQLNTEGVPWKRSLCPFCSVAIDKNETKTNDQLTKLVSKIKDMEPHLSNVPQFNPRTLKLQGEASVLTTPLHGGPRKKQLC